MTPIVDPAPNAATMLPKAAAPWALLSQDGQTHLHRARVPEIYDRDQRDDRAQAHVVPGVGESVGDLSQQAA